ncbi:TPA: hypothetical protein ACH3X1_014919 [Trebouxia sp. C0004]
MSNVNVDQDGMLEEREELPFGQTAPAAGGVVPPTGQLDSLSLNGPGPDVGAAV